MILPTGWMMSLILLTERHAVQIAGVVSCYDRVIVQGTLPVFCYADGMTAYLTKRRIRIFDFTQFPRPLTDAIKANAEQTGGRQRFEDRLRAQEEFPQGRQG